MRIQWLVPGEPRIHLIMVEVLDEHILSETVTASVRHCHADSIFLHLGGDEAIPLS